MHLSILSLAGLTLFSSAAARCFDNSPAYPPPTYPRNVALLKGLFRRIELSITSAFLEKYPTTSFSIEITSSKDTLWSYYHTASERNESRIGVSLVDGDSLYRIASITKVFTVLGVLQQHAAGNLSLDDPVKLYIEELNQPQNGSLPWHSITLRSLASQLSGIPREFAQSDLINELEDPTIIGLPLVPKERLIQCDEYTGYDMPCNRKAFLDSIRAKHPVFAPNWKSTYSNVAFNLLGLVLENVTGMPYSDYVKTAIFEPLELNNTFLDKPNDTHAVLPKGFNYWDVEEGVQRPTGGIYSSSSDMSRFLRYVLSHYNGLTPATNWFQPASYSTGMTSFYGMPWEIYRTTKIVSRSQKPVTFVTKSGGLPQYYSNIILAPDFDLGVTILVGGSAKALVELREIVTVPLIGVADLLGLIQTAYKYTGIYVAADPALNSSLVLQAPSYSGLDLTRFISNSTDVLASPLIQFADPDATGNWRALLSPTLLYRNQSALEGELWRIQISPSRADEEERPGKVWDEFCITDVDPARYAGLPINEVVFWMGEDGRASEIEVSAFRVRLVKKADWPVEEAWEERLATWGEEEWDRTLSGKDVDFKMPGLVVQG